jgi:hypothetical protein
VNHASLDELRAEARYQRRRVDLYRAKTYGGRGGNASRMRELERSAEGAAERLRAAQRAAAP